MESKIAFDRWYKTFIKANGGFLAPSDYFASVQNSHNKLRKFLGGTSLKKQITLKRGIGNESDRILDDVYYDLERIFGYCNIQNIIRRNDLDKQTKTDHHGRQVKLSKFLRQKFLEKKKEGTVSANISAFDKCINTMAYYWSRNKIAKVKYTVKLDTSAKGFANVGHYGMDDTCFSQDGENAHHKYSLGMHDHSFVLTIRRDKNYVARLLGIFYPNMNGAMIFNGYYRHIGYGSVSALVDVFMKRLLGKNVNLILADDLEDGIYVEGIYHNYGEFDWSYVKPHVKPIEKFYIDEVDSFWCNQCERCMNVEEQSDDGEICQDCYNEIYNVMCNHCNEMFDSGDIEYVDDIGEICITCLNTYYHPCTECGDTLIKKDQCVCNYCEDSLVEA